MMPPARLPAGPRLCCLAVALGAVLTIAHAPGPAVKGTSFDLVRKVSVAQTVSPPDPSLGCDATPSRRATSTLFAQRTLPAGSPATASEVLAEAYEEGLEEEFPLTAPMASSVPTAPGERTSPRWSLLPPRPTATTPTTPRTGPVTAVNAASGTWLRAISVAYTNDLFFFKHLNSDRDLTGALRLEALIDPALTQKFSRLPGLITLAAGADAYTPYIRDTAIYNESGTINRDDRPFASFVYVGLGLRRRLGKRGFGAAELRVGALGTDLVSGGQTLIHEYLFPSAVAPRGWETQVAAGGRLGMSLRIDGEWRLDRASISTSRLVPTLLGAGMVGHEGTRVDAGMRLYCGGEPGFGTWGLASRSSSRRLRLAAVATVRARYSLHDSTLEGYGILRPAAGVGPDASGSNYALSRGRGGSVDQIRAWIGIGELVVSARWGRLGVSAKQLVSTAAFDLPGLAARRDERGRPYDASPLMHVGEVIGVWYF